MKKTPIRIEIVLAISCLVMLERLGLLSLDLPVYSFFA